MTVAGTEPYPWPWDGAVDPSRLALVLAGWDTHWAARVTGDRAAVGARTGQLAAAVLRARGWVVAVAHRRPARAAAHLPDPEPLDLPGVAADVRVLSDLDRNPTVPAHDSAVLGVRAGGIDAFYGGPLDALLRSGGRSQLLIAGNGLEGPVHSTLRSANDRGDECLLVADACGPLTSEARVSAAHSVTMSGGIFGAVGTTAAVVEALAALTDTPTLDDASPGGSR